MTKDLEYPARRAKRIYDGSKRETLDMGVNNFLIEVVLQDRPRPHRRNDLASKGDQTGYELALTPRGERPCA